jgi:hypothetical protein
MPVSSRRGPGTDSYEMQIAGLGVAMVVVSIVLLAWAFPGLPKR